MDDGSLHQFYLDLVRRLRDRGVLCAVTSGLACVHYRVAETTKDCDLLCHPEAFGILLATLAPLEVDGRKCSYRGNLSPPLDDRWHGGGWTSHFTWGRGPDAVTLDVFGRALRGSAPWQQELEGLFVSRHIVAEMKRTDRDKDWPFITELGVQLVENGDPRGWLHVFEERALSSLLADFTCPAETQALRPALVLAVQGDPRVRGAFLAERLLWERLDARRIEIYQRALRPYNTAVRRAQIPAALGLLEAHDIRLRCALDTLAQNPLTDHGIERLIAEARQDAIEGSGLSSEAVNWLPDVRANFAYLNT